jgi:hypothetical protein
MTTEERLAKVERELAEAKAQATRAKRRNRWLLTVVGLAVGVLALAWIVAGAANRAQAQGGGVPAVIRAGQSERGAGGRGAEVGGHLLGAAQGLASGPGRRLILDNESIACNVARPGPFLGTGDKSRRRFLMRR